MTQREKKEFVKYGTSNKYSGWSDKTLLNYKDSEKIEDKKGIISMFENETKIDVETSFEVNVKCFIMFKFKEGNI